MYLFPLNHHVVLICEHLLHSMCVGCVCVCQCECTCVCVCACECVREGESDRERVGTKKSERERERERESSTESQRPPAPMNHEKILKGWPSQDAPWIMVQLWYKTFTPDHIDQVEMKIQLG